MGEGGGDGSGGGRESSGEGKRAEEAYPPKVRLQGQHRHVLFRPHGAPPFDSYLLPWPNRACWQRVGGQLQSGILDLRMVARHG
jgi:hypothetical protein